MKAALIGLPQSGKSTLFTSVTGLSVDPYAQPEPRTGVVHVPDPRLAYLTELYNPKKITEATIDFIDVPGCSLDDSSGQENWRRLLPLVRQADLLVVVVRAFENASVPTYKNRIDAVADFSAMWDEMIFADLDTVTTRVERLEKSLKKPTKTQDQEKKEHGLLVKCREALEAGLPLADALTNEDDRKQLSSFGFLTEIPLLCVVNVSDDKAGEDLAFDLPHVEACVYLSASIESEIALLDEADRADFLEDLGLGAPARDRLIRECYRACGLISFLTMGVDEVRAWPVKSGSSAVQASGKIHTDIAQGFIRAETVAYDDLVACKDMKGAKAAGKVRKEGKNYVVADGDILNILSSA